MNIIRTLTAASRELPRILPLMRDARIPVGAKVAAIAAAVFIISPLNILGDIPLLGFLDDTALLLWVAHTFVRYAEGLIAAGVPPMRNAGVPTPPRSAGPTRVDGMLSR